jgi:hypothetical protein
MMAGEFDLENLRLSSNIALPARRAVEPRKLERRRKHFVQVPWGWVEALSGASGQTWHLAIQLLYQHWKGNGKCIKLANGMLKVDGIGRTSKARALCDLEKRKLVAVDRRDRRSPLVTLLNLSQ